MCQGYVYFYPRVELSLCKTQYDFDNFFNAVGIEKVEGQDTLDRLQLPFKPLYVILSCVKLENLEY
jgi:hypothetical protein